jgi:excisionase family DNA binding protein
VPEAWSVQKVAELLHVSETTVRRLIADRAFPGAFRVGRKLVRIPITDLDAYQRRARLLVLEARIAHAEGALDAELAISTPRGRDGPREVHGGRPPQHSLAADGPRDSAVRPQPQAVHRS